MKRDLEEIAIALGVPANEWSIIHICTAWNVIRFNFLTKFTPNGWITKMKNFSSALNLVENTVHKAWTKELRLFMNKQLKNEIDASDQPYRKKGANILPYTVWKKMIDNTFQLKHQSDVKQLRSAQARVLLVWTLSAGARMDELLRLRKSDVKLVTKIGYSYLQMTIRRGKASRLGRRPTFVKCFENIKVESFCPIAAFLEYVEELIRQDLYEDNCLLFPSSVAYKENIISRKAVVDHWKTTAKTLNLPKHHYPQAHSGHAQLINTAWVFDQNDEQLLDITNWNSIRNLPEYVEGPKENSINIIKTTLTAEELDAKCAIIF